MKFFRYWARAEGPEDDDLDWSFVRYGHSNHSQAAALEQARREVQRARDAFRSQGPAASYLYSDRPVREEIVETLGDAAQPTALITRNAYGSLVLNTADIFFADIDHTDLDRRASAPGGGLWGWLGRIFGQTPRPGSAAEVPSLIGQLSRRRPELALRLYRTRAGFRCAITNGLYTPGSPVAESLLGAMGSDPLYVQLCRVQQCFRARLTPKSWRCGLQPPAVRFPWGDAWEERAFRQWEQQYAEVIEGYGVCDLVACHGPAGSDPKIAAVIELHDRLACRDGCPLA